MFTVLVLCTGNSARSILAEALLNHEADGRLRAFSAGSRPAGTVNPHALALLARRGLPTAELRSKSWDEFAAPGAFAFDLVITVCASAAGETCPVWPGTPLRVNWPVEDPAAAPAEAAEAAFRTAWHQLGTRIHAFLALPFETMPHDTLKTALERIGAFAAESTTVPPAPR